jgi:branched-chain amino acid transport system ATP-binding protein
MLQVSGLYVRFAGLTAVHDVSFTARAGQVFTIMGPNGAGKTTLFNAVTGFVKPAQGDVLFDGERITGLPPHAVAARGLRRTFQNNGILREMTALENVLIGLELETQSRFTGCLLGLRNSVRAERAAVDRALAALSRMGIAHLQDETAGDLSFGQQRLIEIARAIASHARLIMLDEPAVGLSPSERLNLGEALRELARDGVAIVLVEHVQDLVMQVSDTVLVLNYGKCIAECAPGELKENEDVLEAYLGR